ncbi:hypothetical protein TKK_0007183 [Trichogramma kaykai]
MANIGDVSANQLMSGASVLSRPAEEFENDQTIEAMWAMKCMQHANIYFNLLSSVDPKNLKLTPHDDVIYKAFRDLFPDFKIDVINEDELKSPASKEKWRPFCEKFKDTVEDYSFGTLIRADCKEDYSQENSILTTRIQFIAIETARNREGFNDIVRSKFSTPKC